MDSSKDAYMCPVCFRIYDDPRILPCGHSFCCSCISKVAGKNRNFPCPTCRKDVKVGILEARGLPKNFSLAFILEDHKMMSALCSEHRKSLDIFCKQCDVPICSKCNFSSHSGHEIQETDDVFNRRKERLTELLESTKPWQAEIKETTDDIRSLRQSVKKTAQVIKANIDDTFKRWSDGLEKQKWTLRRHVDAETELRLKVFDDRLTVLDSADTDISNLKTEMNTTLAKDKTSVLQLFRSMEESHNTVGMKAKQVMEASFAPPPELKIEISAPWMEEAIENIKPLNSSQQESTPVDWSIFKILEETKTLNREFQKLQATMKNTEMRENKKSVQLEKEREKNKELKEELKREKRGQVRKNEELKLDVDELMKNIIEISSEEFRRFKMRLGPQNESLLRTSYNESDDIKSGVGEINTPTRGKTSPARRLKDAESRKGKCNLEKSSGGNGFIRRQSETVAGEDSNGSHCLLNNEVEGQTKQDKTNIMGTLKPKETLKSESLLNTECAI